ncbi:MAG: cellulase family glycosylhydrolase [Ketobacteraceae bacterium]|nr:cellulase family glycosylhydrolase [Ketobacteraceae bacterium]
MYPRTGNVAGPSGGPVLYLLYILFTGLLLALPLQGWAGLPPLHVKRGAEPAIKDHLDRTVLLRGVNLNALGDYYQANPDQPTLIPAGEEDFVQMARLGFNVVRLVLNWSRLEPEPGQINEAYIEQIRTFVNYAKAHGLYTVLDMHQDAWGKHIASDGSEACGFFERSIGWDGAPAWATFTDGASTCRLPGVREVSPAVATAFENFWRNREGIQDALIRVWARLAEEFADEPAVAGYDLLNEPNFGLSAGWTHTFLMGNYYTRVIRAIRKAERRVAGGFHHIAFFEPSAEWSAFGITLWPLGFFIFDPNIVFAPHLYSGSITVTGTIDTGYENAKRVADFYRAPFWSGEWGWFSVGDAAEESVWQYAQREDRYRIGGAVWQWKQACGDPHPQKYWGGREVQEPQYQVNIIYCPGDVEGGISPVYRRVLSRAYPRHSPGRLASLFSDPYEGVLRMTGSSDDEGTAVLWIPASERVSQPEVSGGGPSFSLEPLPGGYRLEVGVSGDYELEIRY